MRSGHDEGNWDVHKGLVLRSGSELIRQSWWGKSLQIEIQRPWASLVAQWLRIRVPMQGTRVQALVQEDPTCRRATKPVCHSY